MKKTMTKSPPKPSQKKAVKDLEVKGAKDGTIRGGRVKPGNPIGPGG